MSKTPTSQQAPPSPISPYRPRRDSVTSELATNHTNMNMLRINNLLNPMDSNRETDTSPSLASTPIYRANDFTPTPTPGPGTPLTPASRKRQRNGKDNAAAKRTAPKGVVNYKSHEAYSNVVCADPEQRTEIIKQHYNFKIAAEGRGLIGEFPKHIPYASGKKDFYDKTGRDAFEFFHYTFVVPDDPAQKVHSVMWDYQIGLVRLTPFFKAFGYSKTTPAKAIKTNPGLEDLVHSITGGALAAQGYWAPFTCARALCLTFCWEIRWALTPIFGTEFVTECLPPGHPSYKRWKIDSNIVRRAELQAEGWKLQASRSATPASPMYPPPNIPMYQTPTSAPTSNPIQLAHSHRERPIFKEGSPFSPDIRTRTRVRTFDLDTEDSDISPKSSPARTYQPSWTSINQRVTPPFPPHNTPINPADRTLQLLTQPLAQESSWRSLIGERSASPASMPTDTRMRQARKRVLPQEDDDLGERIVVASDSSYKSSPASSESSVMYSPPPPPAKKVRRLRRRSSLEREVVEPDEEIVRAAEILISMHEDDGDLRGKW